MEFLVLDGQKMGAEDGGEDGGERMTHDQQNIHQHFQSIDTNFPTFDKRHLL